MGGTEQWSVGLDEISQDHRIRQIGLFKNGCLFTVAVIALASLIMINLPLLVSAMVFLAAMAPLLIGRLLHNYNYIQVETKRGPFLIGYSRSQRADADAFLSALKEASRSYFRWRYGTPGPRP